MRSNLARVEGLAALSEWIEFPARTDLLRASVVLLHATLEDVLRSILELAKHRGKTVDQLIGERIDAYLERSNFNNIDDVVQALTRAGIDTNLLDPYKDPLAALMQRRHWIVHRADHFRSLEAPWAPQPRPISVTTVEGWRTSVERVCAEILARMDRP